MPPDPASDLSVSDQGVSNISLRWELGGDGNSPITGVEFEYREEGGGGEGVDSVGGPALNHTLIGLRGNTNYEVDVYVVNAVGRSNVSQIMGRTDSEGTGG